MGSSGYICCLCGKHSWGWGEDSQFGNNPAPLKGNKADEQECCDKCNQTKVIPERIRELNKRRSEDAK